MELEIIINDPKNTSIGSFLFEDLPRRGDHIPMRKMTLVVDYVSYRFVKEILGLPAGTGIIPPRTTIEKFKPCAITCNIL